MDELLHFILSYALRGDCICGRCSDAAAAPQQPDGHTADLVFFKVSAKPGADKATLQKLVCKNPVGEFCTVDLLDGQEHGFMEIGAWIGDQGMALKLMGLGAVLGLWQLITPKTLLGKDLPHDIELAMAGTGCLAIKALPEETR